MHILVTDFGSAKILDDKKKEVARSEDVEGEVAGGRREGEVAGGRRSSFVGTAQYVSPEVLTGQPTTPAVDLWALGCILYQVLDVDTLHLAHSKG